MLLALALSADSCVQLVVHSLGNVGIGTETPNSPLCISGGKWNHRRLTPVKWAIWATRCRLSTQKCSSSKIPLFLVVIAFKPQM